MKKYSALKWIIPHTHSKKKGIELDIEHSKTLFYLQKSNLKTNNKISGMHCYQDCFAFLLLTFLLEIVKQNIEVHLGIYIILCFFQSEKRLIETEKKLQVKKK